MRLVPPAVASPYYADAHATLYHGDAVDVQCALPDASVAVVLTDPPFSSGTRREAAKGIRKSMTRGTDAAEWFGSDSLTTNGLAYLLRECARQWLRVLVPGGHALVFIDWRMAPTAAAAIESADLRHAGVLVWDKTYFGMGACFRNQHEMVLHFTKGVGRAPQRRDVGNVLRCAPIRNGTHPTEKPVALLGELLSVVAPPGGVVLDCFAGTGATGVASVLAGRRFVGVERETPYLDVAARRLGSTSPAPYFALPGAQG